MGRLPAEALQRAQILQSLIGPQEQNGGLRFTPAQVTRFNLDPSQAPIIDAPEQSPIAPPFQQGAQPQQILKAQAGGGGAPAIGGPAQPGQRSVEEVLAKAREILATPGHPLQQRAAELLTQQGGKFVPNPDPNLQADPTLDARFPVQSDAAREALMAKIEQDALAAQGIARNQAGDGIEDIGFQGARATAAGQNRQGLTAKTILRQERKGLLDSNLPRLRADAINRRVDAKPQGPTPGEIASAIDVLKEQNAVRREARGPLTPDQIADQGAFSAKVAASRRERREDVDEGRAAAARNKRFRRFSPERRAVIDAVEGFTSTGRPRDFGGEVGAQDNAVIQALRGTGRFREADALERQGRERTFIKRDDEKIAREEKAEKLKNRQGIAASALPEDPLARARLLGNSRLREQHFKGFGLGPDGQLLIEGKPVVNGKAQPEPFVPNEISTYVRELKRFGAAKPSQEEFSAQMDELGELNGLSEEETTALKDKFGEDAVGDSFVRSDAEPSKGLTERAMREFSRFVDKGLPANTTVNTKRKPSERRENFDKNFRLFR